MYDNTPVDRVQPIQLVAEENYKLTRAAWFALYAPDSRRHDALLADDIPDVYRRLFDAILDGTRGLARLAAAGGDELALLDIIALLPRPRLIPTRRLDLPDNPDLAAALFGDVADGLDLPGLGSGDWPTSPAHTCGAQEAIGTALIIRPNETRGARMYNPTWRTCRGCLAKRVQRLARQTLIEIAFCGGMTWATMDGRDYRKWAGNIRQHRRRTGDEVRFRALPQEDGRYFVMSSHGLAGDPIPTDRGALFELLHPYANTPDGKRASSSRGFGGDYKRLRGDGRDGPAGVRLWTDSSLEAVAGALGIEIKRGRNTIRVQIDASTSYQKLTEAGIAMHARKGQGAAVQVMAAALTEENVTLKVQGEAEESLYLKRDTEGVGAGIALDPCPPQFDFCPDEVQTWPT